MRQAEVRDYYGAVLLYNFFGQLNFIKWKNSKLESCRSRRGLQFSYKNHLHPMSYRRVMVFQRFSRNKLEKKKQNRGNCSKSGFTVANRGRTVPCKPCKPDWTWGERVRKFEGLDVWFLSSCTYLTQRYKFKYPRCILLYCFWYATFKLRYHKYTVLRVSWLSQQYGLDFFLFLVCLKKHDECYCL